MKKYDVAVVGGGLVGRMLAWQLASEGVRVALYEAGTHQGEGAAAYVAAAMLAPTAEAIDGTPLAVKLGYQSMPLWQAMLPKLPERVWMQQNGSLIIWHGQDRALAQQFAAHLRRAHAGESCWQHWDAATLAAAEPQLGGRFGSGFFLPTEGQLDNRQLLLALATAAEEAGVACHWQHTATVAEAQVAAHWVVDCRGFAAKADWNGQPGSQLRGIRGEVARVHAPEVTLNRPVRLLHPRYPLYIAPKQNHVFVIGATQIESEDAGPVSVRSGLELFSALYAVHPAFGEARVLETASGLRPTLSHENPAIRYCPAQRLVAVNGLFRHGFMIAPAVVGAAQRLLQQVLHGQPVMAEDAVSGMVYELNDSRH